MTVDRKGRRRTTNFVTYASESGGNKNANGNYASAATQFALTPPDGKSLYVERMIISLEDSGVFKAEGYGAIATGLTNGIRVQILGASDAVVLNCDDELAVTTNAGWGINNYDVVVKDWGSGNKLLLARWTFTKDHGQPLVLDARYGERLVITLNDDCTDLLQHRFRLSGTIYG